MIEILRRYKFDLTSEQKLKDGMEAVFLHHGEKFEREYRLDNKNIPDYFQPSTGIALEVKIRKCSPAATIKQCERYAMFDEVKMVILFTNKAHDIPAKLNGKPFYIISAGKAWL